MSRVGLTEAEEKRLLILLEGDQSDLEGSSDIDADDLEEEQLFDLQGRYDPDPPIESLELLPNLNLVTKWFWATLRHHTVRK